MVVTFIGLALVVLLGRIGAAGGAAGGCRHQGKDDPG
jgi:hypothetical protein